MASSAPCPALTEEKLAESAEKALNVHGIGKEPAAPKVPAPEQEPDEKKRKLAQSKWELWTSFSDRARKEPMTVTNYFYPGYEHDEIDWKRPVHGFLVDFKADGMQMGMIIQRLVERNEQFIFIGMPLPFNDAWHFTAVDDYEVPAAQKEAVPSWRCKRIWHRVNYVPGRTAEGAAALVPRVRYNKDNITEGAIPIDANFKLTTIFLVGGLMAGTLIANVVKAGRPVTEAGTPDNEKKSPATDLIERHLSLNVTIGAIGHGLGVAVAAGSKETSAIEGYEVGHGGDRACRRMVEVNKLKGHDKSVNSYTHTNGAKLVFATVWGCHQGKVTCEEFFTLIGFQKPDTPAVPAPSKLYTKASNEITIKLDMGPIMEERKFGKGDVVEVWSASQDKWLAGAVVEEAMYEDTKYEGYDCKAGTIKVSYPGGQSKFVLKEEVEKVIRHSSVVPTYNAGSDRPCIAIVVDHCFDPVEAFAVIAKCLEEKVSFQFVSHSAEREGEIAREITSETVFGNAMYTLCNCCLKCPTVCADKVSPTKNFAAFAVAGGQGPFHLVLDAGVISLLDRIPLAGAVCHGPMALIGTKWLNAANNFQFTSFNGAWIYFRDIANRRQALAPGQGVFDIPMGCKLFTGNSPVGAKDWTDTLFKALLT